MKSEIDGTVLEVVEGDITEQDDVDAIVNAANAQLQSGGGVAGAIHRAAGPDLARAGRDLAPIRPGMAVITEGFALPNDYVIHCLGPVYGQDEPAAELLAECYRNALRIAEDRRLSSIAFPSISTGAFGYPMEDAARVALSTTLEVVPRLSHVRLIRFVLFGGHALKVHERELEKRLRDAR